MPPRTTSRRSALLLLLPCPDLSSSPFGSRNAFPSPRIFIVYPREREDVLPTIREERAFPFLPSYPSTSAWRSSISSISLSSSVPLSFLRFLYRSAPGGPYESFNSIFFSNSALRASRTTRHDVLSFEIHLFGSETHPGPDSIFLLP